jgi:hypothetical protein
METFLLRFECGQRRAIVKSRPLLLLAAATLACLLPFLGKAIHIDDPLFVWTAQHLQSHPLDFYGFTVDWGLAPARMFEQMQNPPLAAYYLAVVGAILGWSEEALHFGFLFPALAFVVGTFFLARRLSAHPLATALAALAAPVFLLSATSLMCDTLMMALWVWAIYFWLQGMEQKSSGRLAVAAMLIAACSLAKYFGACLVPLLLAYSLARERRAGWWLMYLCWPILVLAGYQWLTCRFYGQGLLTSAATYATTLRIGGGIGTKLIETLAFTGGCLLVPLLAAPLLWSRKGLAASLAAVIGMGLLVLAMRKLGITLVVSPGHVKWLLMAQLALFACGGMMVLVLAALDLKRHKTPESLLLFLWITGTFVFVAAVNWTISGRNILPLLPAACILLTRRLESQPQAVTYFCWPLGVSLVVALLAAEGDWQFANSARQAAFLINRQPSAHSGPIYFEGHWGFQYYMQQLGAHPLVLEPLGLNPGQIVVMPMNNTCWVDLPPDRIEPLSNLEVKAASWISLMNNSIGAGYYSDDWGPAPFVFGPAKPEQYSIVRVK